MTLNAQGLPASLIRTESGGNFRALNNEQGAGGRGHGGRGQFGHARLADAARAGVIPAGTTPQQFAQMPEPVQIRVENWHANDINQQIAKRGLDRFVGQNIGGTTVTPQGMLAVAHLGGIGGLDKFLNSGGQYNPSDSFGTSLSNYLATHSGQAVPAGQARQPQPQAQPATGGGFTQEQIAAAMGQAKQPQQAMQAPEAPQMQVAPMQPREGYQSNNDALANAMRAMQALQQRRKGLLG